MGPLTIAALIAAAAAAAGTGHATASNARTGIDTKNGPTKKTGFFADWGKLFGVDSDVSSSELGKWFQDNYTGSASDYINSLDPAELGALLEQYYDEDKVLGGTKYTFDYKDAVSNLEELINGVNQLDMPSAPDFENIYNEAQKTIEDENAELIALLNSQNAESLDLLDKNKFRQTQNYQNELDYLNQSYNDYSRQILSNDYIKNQQLMGTVSSALSKSKQNALEAGASAGARLAGNINTIMAIQNKQTQQSLETSNQLAQAMLNQRQAAAGLRANYNDMLSSDTQNRLGLSSNYGNNLRSIKQGAASNALNYANQQFNTQNQIYQNQMSNYEQAMSNYQSNPFYGSYQSYQQNKRYKNNQGY